jgi:chemotaxis protein MotB
MKTIWNNNIIFLISAVIITTIMSSCVVSKKQFDELLAEKVKQEAEMQSLQNELADLNSKLTDLETRFATTSELKDNLTTDLDKTTAELDELQAEHDKLKTYYNNALSNSGKLNRDIAEQQERLLALQATLDQAKFNNDLLADSLTVREARVAELERVLAESHQAVNDLKAKVNAALTNFGIKDLTIKQQGGRVYVSLSEQLLFKSGSISVDPKGQKALKQLAEALTDSPEIQVTVEGHTDNVPISKTSKYMSDNWDLSVMRATSIVKILLRYGVSPGSLTASGKGEFSPVAGNDTAANKQLNRRTEIILTPDLTELFEILGN